MTSTPTKISKAWINQYRRDYIHKAVAELLVSEGFTTSDCGYELSLIVTPNCEINVYIVNNSCQDLSNQ